MVLEQKLLGYQLKTLYLKSIVITTNISISDLLNLKYKKYAK